MKSFENAYKNRRTPRFIGKIGRHRPIDVFNPHQRFGLNASNRTVTKMSWPFDHGWTLRIDPRDVRYITHQFAPVGSQSDDRDAFPRVKSWPS